MEPGIKEALPKPAEPRATRVNQEWLEAWIKGNAYLPFSFLAIVPLIGEKLTQGMIDQNTSWNAFQDSKLSDEQLSELDKRVSRIYHKYKLPKVPEPDAYMRVWESVKERMKDCIGIYLEAHGHFPDSFDEFFKKRTGRRALKDFNRVLSKTREAVFSPEVKELAKTQRTTIAAAQSYTEFNALNDKVIVKVIADKLTEF